MKTKKWLAALLALAMTASALPAVDGMDVLHTTATSSNSGNSTYFYDQLKGSDYQQFYRAMEQMAVYGAARDAFTGDHPEIFYVDFSALSIRIKTYSNGEYHLYLGKGRRENYWTESFQSAEEVTKAIADYNTAFDTAYNSLTGSTDAEFVESAHDYVTKNTSYRLENKFAEGDTAQYLIRTAYGSLVNHKAVCEGYARLFKAFMDKRGIPCILVQGAYRPDAESYELHMWTYVEIDGAWYAVDPTIDDPTNSKKRADEVGIDGYENHEYLLKGDNKMAVKYAPSGIRSESNYAFTYPELSYDNYGNEVVYNSNGLMVEFEEGTQEDGEKCGVFRVSYKGMGLYEAREAGYYIMYDCLVEKGGITSMSRSASKNDPSYEKLVAEAPIGDMMWTGMKYIGMGIPELQGVTPDVFNNDGEAENSDFYTTPDHLVLKLPQTPYVKFAVTRVKPGMYATSEETGGAPIYDGDYYGTPDELFATSDAIFNKNGMYKAPPYPTEVSPTLTSALLIDDGKRTISAKFDKTMHIDEAYLAENGGRISLRMNLQDMYEIKNRSGYDHSAVENFRLIFADGAVSEPVKSDLSLIVK